jgi:hypothetical protein
MGVHDVIDLFLDLCVMMPLTTCVCARVHTDLSSDPFTSNQNIIMGALVLGTGLVLLQRTLFTKVSGKLSEWMKKGQGGSQAPNNEAPRRTQTSSVADLSVLPNSVRGQGVEMQDITPQPGASLHSNALLGPQPSSSPQALLDVPAVDANGEADVRAAILQRVSVSQGLSATWNVELDDNMVPFYVHKETGESRWEKPMPSTAEDQ